VAEPFDVVFVYVKSYDTEWAGSLALPVGASPEHRQLGRRQLAADLRAQHLSRDATRGEQTRYGQKYAIRATLVGPSGGSADVVSVWVVRTGEDFPRFLTAYPEGD